MCRLVAYSGEREVDLASLVLEPEHSLLVQSYAPQEMLSGVVNADGFGVGWYAPQVDETPAVYTSNRSLWSDRSFASVAPKVRSSRVFGALRNATPGLPAEESGVPPFARGRYLFMHNGAIEDFRHTAMRRLRGQLTGESYAGLLGTSDSETLFALLADRLVEVGKGAQALAAATRETLRRVRESLPETHLALNFGLTDGSAMVFTRHSRPGPGNSLYVLEDGAAYPGAVVVASERLDADPGWRSVPDDHLLVVDEKREVGLYQL